MTSFSITNIVINICVWKKSTVLIFPVILSEASSVDQDSLKRVPLQCNIVGTQCVHVCDGSFCVHVCSDYEFQVCIVEFLFRLLPRKLRQKYSKNFIMDPETLGAFLAVKDSCFEVVSSLEVLLAVIRNISHQHCFLCLNHIAHHALGNNCSCIFC